MRQLTGNGGVPKEVRPLIREAQRQGWSVRFTGRNHVLFLSPEGGVPVITAGTPSSPRTLRRLTADLRRRGLKL